MPTTILPLALRLSRTHGQHRQNLVRNMVVVTLVGADGNFGHKVLPVLVAEETISEVRCLSRKSTGKSISKKVKYIKVDYSDPGDLENALGGSDILINAMGTNLDHLKNKVALVDAAAAVGVRIYIPRLCSHAPRYLTVANLGSIPMSRQSL